MTMKQASEEEFQNNQNPNGQSEKDTYSAEEYKNLQAFWTKANQGLINVSKKLAEQNPKELLWMDAQIQNKVIKDLYWYDNLEELKIMLPDVFIENSDDNDYKGWENESDMLVQMKKEQELLKMKLNKKDVDDEIEKYTSSNSSMVSSIPNFNDKIKDELKYISSELSTKERVERATKLITGGSDINVDAYLQLQWKAWIVAGWQKLTDDYILEAQNKFRASLWLKQK